MECKGVIWKSERRATLKLGQNNIKEGVLQFPDQFKKQMSTSQLYIYTQLITLNCLYCSQGALLSSTRNKIKFWPAEKEATRWGWVFLGGSRKGCRRHFCTSFFIISCCSCFPLGGDQRGGADVWGLCTGYNKGRHAHHIHWTLKKYNNPLISVLCQGLKNASSDLCLVFGVVRD